MGGISIEASRHVILVATAATVACTQSALGMSTAADDVDRTRDPIDVEAASADSCDLGSVVGDVYGRVLYFGRGVFLPRGRYRVAYVDGCMKYSGSQDWALHAYPLDSSTGSDHWWIVDGARRIVMPSGTVGFKVSSGGFATFDECVAANLALPATEFDFGGGLLGLWLEDRPYGDNLPGLDGRSPTWRLTALHACERTPHPQG